MCKSVKLNLTIMELTADQQTSVNSLKEIADIEDRDILIAVLIESKWDLDRAVKTLMSDEQPFLSSTPDKQSSTNSSLSSSNSVQSHNHHSDRSSYIASQSDSLHNTSSQQPKLSIFSFAVAPFTLTISTIYKIILYIYRYINPRDKQPMDNKQAAKQFIDQFDKLYDTLHPEMIPTSYSQALEVAKSNLRYMVVYLNSSQHDDTTTFCKDTLCSQTIVDYFKQKNILFWCGDISQSEAFQVSGILSASRYPFVALVAPQGSKMQVVDRFQGKRTAQELCSQLDNHVSRIDAALSNMRMNREDQNITRNLRQTQESAYQISLRKDQAKKMKSKIAEDKRLSEAHHVKTLKESKLTRIEGLRRNLKCEPEGNEGIAKLSIRLPNGTRLVRKFQGTDTLQVLMDFVEVQDLSPVPFEREVNIVNTYPRKVLDIQSGMTLNGAGLFPSASVIVEEAL